MLETNENEVRSHHLTFAYNDSFLESAKRVMEKYSVTIEVVNAGPVDASGFPLVSVRGLPHRVVKCIAECWDDGGHTNDEMWDFGNMMIGMEGAGFMWNHGQQHAQESLIYAENFMHYFHPGVDYEAAVKS